MPHVGLGTALPGGVEMAVREKPRKRIVFLLNYTEKAQTVSLRKSLQNVMSAATEPAEVQIAPFDLKVLVEGSSY